MLTDAIPNRPYYPTKTLLRGVNAAVDAFDRCEKVMVFCKSGRHRSVTTSCCILVAQGYTADEAIELVESKRSESDLNPALRQRIVDFEKVWLEQNGRDQNG